MTDGACGFPREWLVALRDGDLQAAQLEIAELHLRVCPDCRRWMDEMDAVDRLLRQETPYRDNPIARAEIKARVATAPLRARPFGTSAVARRARRALSIGLSALAVLILVTGLWREPLTEAGSGLGDWLREEPSRQPSAQAIANATPIVAPTVALGPRELPFGLAQVGALQAGEGFTQRFFRVMSGLSISYTINCDPTSFVTLPRDDELSEVAGVNGASVQVVYGLNRESVVALYWQHENGWSEVLILEHAPQPLSLDDGLLIAAALLAREEGSTAVACGG